MVLELLNRCGEAYIFLALLSRAVTQRHLLKNQLGFFMRANTDSILPRPSGFQPMVYARYYIVVAYKKVISGHRLLGKCSYCKAIALHDEHQNQE